MSRERVDAILQSGSVWCQIAAIRCPFAFNSFFVRCSGATLRVITVSLSFTGKPC